jgi:hypothetical protein
MFMPKRFLIFLLVAGLSCDHGRPEDDRVLEEYERQLNKETEKLIDAAYARLQEDCDSLMTHQVPLMVDSILHKTDSL